MEDACRKTGGELLFLEDENREFIQSLGKMETVSKSARGRLGELSTAFADLKTMYNRLSDDEKRSEFGKEINKQLDILKERVIDAKGELNKINEQIQNNGSLLDQLSSKFGVNIKQLGGWGAALGAGKVALDVMKVAFFSNEEQLDEWGRIVQSSESVYNGFLDALNTGDISGFLSRISQIVNAARDAYDALDELATYNAFNQINVQKARTTFTESMADYRSGTGSKDKVKAAGEEMKKQLRERAEKEKDSYNQAINQLASERGVSAADLRKVMSGQYGDYKNLKDLPLTGIGYKTVGGGMFGGGQTVETRYAKNEKERLGAALRRINDDKDLDRLQALGAQANKTAEEIAQIDKQMARVLGGGGRTGGGGSGRTGRTTKTTVKAEEIIPEGSILEAEKKLQELKKKWRAATSDDARNWLKWQIEDAEREYDKLLGKTKEWKSPAVELGLAGKGASLGDLQKAMGFGDLNKDAFSFSKEDFDREEFRKKQQEELEKNKKDPFEDVGKFVSGLEGIAGGLKEMGVEMPEGMDKLLGGINGLMSIIQGVQTVISVFGTSTQTANTIAVGANTAALAALTTVVTTNTVSNFLPFPFAYGGVVRAATGFVGGNKYSGDNIPALLNSGETVLNAAQTANLSTKLNNNAQQRMNAQPYLDCEKIYLGLNTFLGATGRGELLTTRG